MYNFSAGTQYNDLTGTSAADRADLNRIEDFLMKIDKIKVKEHVLGCNIYSSDMTIEEKGLSITFIVAPLPDGMSVPELLKSDDIEYREVDLWMKPIEFFKYFKRFNITLSNGGQLENRSIEL